MSESVIYKTEDGNFVRFEYGTVKNEIASNTEGRPIFDKVFFAYITCPGQKNSEMCHEIEREYPDGRVRVRQEVAQRFAKQIQAFKSQSTSPELNGTPLSGWPALDVRQIAELKAQNIHTVEALAALSDTGLSRVGAGARDLQAKAKAFLESAKSGAHAQQLAVELGKRDETIARLEGQVKELAALLEEKTKPKKVA